MMIQPKNDTNDDEYWAISKDELDRKANNEVVVTIDVRKGTKEDVDRVRNEYQESQRTIKAGILYKNRPSGLRLYWQERYFILTSTELTYRKSTIPLKNITKVQVGTGDLVHPHVFEIHVNHTIEGRGGTGRKEPYKLAASTAADRDDWMNQILKLCPQLDGPTGVVDDGTSHPPMTTTMTSSRISAATTPISLANDISSAEFSSTIAAGAATAGTTTTNSYHHDNRHQDITTVNDNIECVESYRGTEVLPS